MRCWLCLASAHPYVVRTPLRRNPPLRNPLGEVKKFIKRIRLRWVESVGLFVCLAEVRAGVGGVTAELFFDADETHVQRHERQRK